MAEIQCSVDKIRLKNGLIDLDADGARAQNQYFYYKNTKQIVGDLQKWLPRVRIFLDQHKNELPASGAFEAARGSRSGGLFPNRGDESWSDFEAKRRVLQALEAEVDARNCQIENKAAIGECEIAGNCQVNP
jgi:hypothetical protein